MNDAGKPKLDATVKCCACKRQQRIDGKGWIYCIYINDMLEYNEYDETGETNGCSEYEAA